MGFSGPYAGTKHRVMVWGTHRLTIPSNAEFSVPQLRMMLREVEAIINRPVLPDEWTGL